MKKKYLLLLIIVIFSANTFGQEKNGTAYMVSNAHLDTQWNWDVQKSIGTFIRNTLTQNLYLLDKYPDYIFNFEGGIKYNWIKEYYPREYEKMKEYIKSGRWHVSGASWDANDTNIPSPESFFRNVLLGQEFYKKEFGIKSTDIFLPDCFGFGYTLPTIAAHCGLIGFSTQKLRWRSKPFHNGSKVPFLFGIWEGIDGSKILAAADAKNYVEKFEKGDVSLDKDLAEFVAQSVNSKAYRYYGTGDKGGSPTIPSVVSVVEGINGKGPINIVSATSDQLFKEYLPAEKQKGLPVYKGELLMDVHATGCYTSQAAMKLYNRRNEQLADAAERASVIADWLGGAEYPTEKLNEAWKRFIWHQFHDDLTGTSIPKAYTFSWNDELLSQSQFNDVLTYSSSVISKGLNTNVSGLPVVVFNSLSHKRKDLVHAYVPITQKTNAVDVYCSKGKKVKSQLLSWDNGIAEILFSAEVEPVSYSVYEVRKSESSNQTNLKAGNNWIENSVYKVSLDKNGDISSIIDKRNNKELVKEGASIRLALINGNPSYKWPAWEILKSVIDKTPVAITENVKTALVETGATRVTLKVERDYEESKFIQFISLTDGGADDRIDIRTEIDWKQTDALLKAEFPLNISNTDATYDLGIGAVERGVNTETAYEVYAQKWADLSETDKSYGVSVVSDCKYGWDKPDNNTIRLTLLHTPSTSKYYVYQDKQDIGRHVLTYSIIGHQSDYINAGIIRKAENQNVPLYAYITDKHTGKLGKEFSMLKINSDNIDIKAFKKAENSDSYIVRIYESAAKEIENAEIEFAVPIVSATEVNGIEEDIRPAKFSENKLFVSTSAYKPKTYRITFSDSPISIKPEKKHFVDLKFNSQGFSSDAFREIAELDSTGNSFSYDLLPEKFIDDGSEFRFGKLGYNNVIKCNGDTIELQATTNNKMLHLLVASADKDKTVTFYTDNNKYERFIPYYSGFYGQWDYEGNRSYIKDAKVSYIGTHRHNKITGDEPYVFTYMFRVTIPIENTKNIILPKDNSIIVFSATLSDNENLFYPAKDFRTIDGMQIIK